MIATVEEKKRNRKVKLCICLDPDLVRKAEFVAQEDQRSFSGYVSKLLVDDLKRKTLAGGKI